MGSQNNTFTLNMAYTSPQVTSTYPGYQETAYTTTGFPSFSEGLRNDPSTRRLFYSVGTAHDLESHDASRYNIYATIQASHLGQQAIVALWAAGNLFHVGWQGNYNNWVTNP